MTDIHSKVVFVEDEFITFFVDCIICEVHAEVVEIVPIRFLIWFSGESR